MATAAVRPAPCSVSASGSIALSVAGGVQPYQYAWSNGATTASLTGLRAGLFNVTVTDANLCTASNVFAETSLCSTLLVSGLQGIGEVGVEFSGGSLSATGGSGSGYVYSIVSGTLPAGLALDPTSGGQSSLSSRV